MSQSLLTASVAAQVHPPHSSPTHHTKSLPKHTQCTRIWNITTSSKIHPIHMPFEKLKFKQELKKKHSLSKIIEKKKPLCPIFTPTLRRFSQMTMTLSILYTTSTCANRANSHRGYTRHPLVEACQCCHEDHCNEWIWMQTSYLSTSHRSKHHNNLISSRITNLLIVCYVRCCCHRCWWLTNVRKTSRQPRAV